MTALIRQRVPLADVRRSAAERDQVLAQADQLVDAVRREVRLAESMAGSAKPRHAGCGVPHSDGYQP